ncbi:MAG: hypothetical protein WBM52_22470 [Thiogranum sp.]
MYLRRLFTIWFLLFTLTSSAAWAMDDHSADHHGNSALEADSDHGKPLPWSQDDCADHCCHASAHAMGLISFTTDIAVRPLSDSLFVSENTPGSLTLAPPFHPPIA